MNTNSLKLVEVDQANKEILLNLLQAYEGEFSSITSKVPDIEGVFPLDSNPDECLSFLFYAEYSSGGLVAPVGFAMKSKANDIVEFKEFYVVPSLRRKGIAELAMRQLLKRFPGVWHIKTLLTAEHATAYWNKLITKLQSDGLVSDVLHTKFEDAYWGEVNLITFKSPR